LSKTKETKSNQYSLVIVESPAKAKTIKKILGAKYKIESSVGHIRDLPKKKIGVNVRKDFEATYEIIEGKEKVASKLIKLSKEAEFVYLATDPDREGEAIAWHLSCILKIPKKKIFRVRFNEITKKVVQSAIENKEKINQSKVEAQQARRILDRIVGYRVSPLIIRRIGGRSAGRVQSVAVRLIVEKEDLIQSFIPEEYWVFSGDFISNKKSFSADLFEWKKKKLATPLKFQKDKNLVIRNKKQAEEISSYARTLKELEVSSVSEKTSSKKPSPPFITSTLQRNVASVLGFGVKKTMQVAQQLYEGIELEQKGSPVGLITYMRTDSTRISEEAKKQASDYINSNFGKEYLPQKVNTYAQKKSAQDAHEAIRPTSVERSPEIISKFLNKDQLRLYRLIWQRFLASQMSEAKITRKTVEIIDQSQYLAFRTSSSKVTFLGYQKVYLEAEKEHDQSFNLPDLKKSEKLKLLKFNSKQKFTEPPARYNEASLVKTLEELGIGRPSTYASIISTIIDRKYVEKTESKSLSPTKLGKKVNQVLIEYFNSLFQASFTAKMEEKLDEIEKSKLDWKLMLKDFYLPFRDTLKQAQKEIESVQIPTEIDCPREGCSGSMVFKTGRFGPFLSCSNYPDCDQTMRLDSEGEVIPPPQKTETDCPKCGAKMFLKKGRYGEFLACLEKECSYKMPIVKSTGVKCPRDNCKGEIVEKKSKKNRIFYGCSEWSKTSCDVVFWNKPIQEKCPKCSSILLEKTLKKEFKITCSNSECDFERSVIRES